MKNNSISTYEEVLKLYEDFEKHKGCFMPGNLEKTSFVSPFSLHSSISATAYGKALEKECIILSGGGKIGVKVNLDGLDSRRYYLKINCCLEHWRELKNDISILINDKKFYYSEEEFIENICQGWPSLYYPINKNYLKNGENIIEVSTNDSSKAGLLISEVCIISLPDIPHFSQVSYLRAVREHQKFAIAIYTGENYTSHSGIENNASCSWIENNTDNNTNNDNDNDNDVDNDDIDGVIENVEITPNCLFKGYSLSTMGNGVCIIKFEAVKAGHASCKVKFKEKDEWIELVMPDIVDAADDECLIGIDSDDHRHDMSDEANRILEIFAMTGMGNFLQFRPSTGRTHLTFADEKTWAKRIHFLTDMEINVGIADTRSHLMGFVPELAGNHYIGSHIHEPYLFFCLPLENTRNKDVFMVDSKAVLASESFGESEKIFRNVLKKTYEKNATRVGSASVGSPSLLCIYEASENFDRITLEPVSNINLLTGAVRGTARSPKQWGAHIPIDWYFGSPNDDCKSRKFRLAMNYLYISGARYIYTENAVLKTNAFSREDWEDLFTSTNRQFLRDFYEYTIRNPRKGQLIVKKAVIYGRHEHFLWHYNDRMAELKDMQNWDQKVWGKWENDSYRKCWRAIDSWLPPAEKQYSFERDENLKLFSGTPYGNVDIIPWWEDFSKYDSIALLGWNTMNIELLDKLKDYVYNGGTLFISYCHLNTTDRNDKPQVFIDNVHIEDFLGVKIGSSFNTCGGIIFNDGFETSHGVNTLRAVECTPDTATVMARDFAGRGIYFANMFGKGKVYFGAFMDYFTEDWSVLAARHIMDIIGVEGDTYCNNPNVVFTERLQEDGSLLIDVINMNCAIKNGREKFKLKIGMQLIEDEVEEGKIYSYELL